MKLLKALKSLLSPSTAKDTMIEDRTLGLSESVSEENVLMAIQDIEAELLLALEEALQYDGLPADQRKDASEIGANLGSVLGRLANQTSSISTDWRDSRDMIMESLTIVFNRFHDRYGERSRHERVILDMVQ